MPEPVRITRDPNNDQEPEWEAAHFQQLFEALATEENTVEVIRQRQKDAWAASHQEKLAAWNAQVAADEEAALARQAAQAEEDRRNQEEAARREQAAAKEKEQRNPPEAQALRG
ncbi:hypothetical protein BKA70DRAFT_1423526 [Coprinopsis sp. MPI-PUGE-AT-0042]|nr:hypothetical protein BKA70DRAFT_1423526 [Coprinopsis sp. MPI-PUGE-AT-0042]